MDIGAYLTFGWKANPEDSFSAVRIHREAKASKKSYKDALTSLIRNVEANQNRITGLELLFRKRVDGFNELKDFIGELSHLNVRGEYAEPITCEIDAFAYGFLKGAKNFDLLLPLEKKSNPEYDAEYKRIHESIKQLETFEREGKPISSKLRETYLALRGVMVRPSARDERRAMATLLVSGPSTLKDISKDLGLNYSLGQRSLAVYEKMGVVGRHSNGIFYIYSAVLPEVVFCLREAMGIDLLTTI